MATSQLRRFFKVMRELEQNGIIKELCPSDDAWHWQINNWAELPGWCFSLLEWPGCLTWAGGVPASFETNEDPEVVYFSVVSSKDNYFMTRYELDHELFVSGSAAEMGGHTTDRHARVEAFQQVINHGFLA